MFFKQCGHNCSKATDCCSSVSRQKLDVIQMPVSPFVSAKSLMSTTHNYFRMELGIPIVKRAHGKSHYV